MNSGSGRHWLLLRGLTREAAHWGEFIPLLQATFPAAHIHTLDLPGSGQLYRQQSPNNITEITEQVRRQAAEQGLLQQPFTVLALSMGGMVAWEWLHQFPEEINGAVLVNTSFATLSPFYRRLRWQSYPQLLQVLLQTDVYQRELAIIRLVSNRRNHDDKTAKIWSGIQSQRPVSPSNSLRQMIAAATYKPASGKPKQPVLIVNSRGDRLVAPLCSDAIFRKWSLENDLHPWAGHDLSLDDGEWLATRLKNWAASQSA